VRLIKKTRLIAFHWSLLKINKHAPRRDPVERMYLVMVEMKQKQLLNDKGLKKRLLFENKIKDLLYLIDLIPSIVESQKPYKFYVQHKTEEVTVNASHHVVPFDHLGFGSLSSYT
jgi:hypothetical protein